MPLLTNEYPDELDELISQTEQEIAAEKQYQWQETPEPEPQQPEAPEEPGYGEVFIKSLARGVEGLAQGVGSATRWAGELGGDPTLARMGEESSDYWEGAQQKGWAKRDPNLHRGTFMENPSLKRAFSIATEAAPSMALGMAAGGAGMAAGLSEVAAGWLGGTALSVLEGSGDYEAAREAGKSVGEASVSGFASTAGTAVLESLAIGKLLGIGKVARRIPGSGRLAKAVNKYPFSKDALTGFMVEGGQEAAQTAWQNLVAKMGYEPTRDLAEGIVESFIGGAGMGGVAGPTMGKINRALEKAQKSGVTDDELDAARQTLVDDIEGKAAQTMPADQVDQGPPPADENAPYTGAPEEPPPGLPPGPPQAPQGPPPIPTGEAVGRAVAAGGMDANANDDAVAALSREFDMSQYGLLESTEPTQEQTRVTLNREVQQPPFDRLKVALAGRDMRYRDDRGGLVESAGPTQEQLPWQPSVEGEMPTPEWQGVEPEQPLAIGQRVSFTENGRQAMGEIKPPPTDNPPEGNIWVEKPDGSGSYFKAEDLSPTDAEYSQLRPEDENIISLLKAHGVKPHGSRAEGRSSELSDLDISAADFDGAINTLKQNGYSIDEKTWGATAKKGEHSVDVFKAKEAPAQPAKEAGEEVKKETGGEVRHSVFMDEMERKYGDVALLEMTDEERAKKKELEKTIVPEIKEQYQKEHGDKPVVLTNKKETLGVMITPSSKEPGRFQMTYWDDRGFAGDRTFDTEEDAILDAYGERYRKPNPALLEKLSTTERFIEGNKFADRVERENQESWEKVQARRKAEEEKAPLPDAGEVEGKEPAPLKEYSIDGTHTYNYVHNTEKAPKAGADDTYGQGIEPAGKYMNLLTPRGAESQKAYNEKEGLKQFEIGQVSFDNPLIVPAEGTTREWKELLSKQYGGLTGKKLSDAIAKDGHDGIITMQKGQPSEVVALSKAQPDAGGVEGKEPWEMTRDDFAKGEPLPKNGRFNPEKPPKPIGDSNISAVMVDNGDIYYDGSAKIHSDVIENLGIPAERVVDGGFIVDGEYKPGSADSFGIGEQNLAKRKVAHRLSVAKALKEGKPVPESVLKDYPDLQSKGAENPKSIGTAWVGNKWKPIVASREIRRGKKKGQFRVTFGDGKSKTVETVRLDAVEKGSDENLEAKALEEIKTTKGNLFRSKKSARSALKRRKKSEFDYDLIEQDGKYLWREKEDKPTPDEKLALEDRAAAQRKRELLANAKDIGTAVMHAGGLRKNDPTHKGDFRDRSRGKGGWPPSLFDSKGLYADEMTATMIENGWLPEGATEDDLIDAIDRNSTQKVSGGNEQELIDKYEQEEIERYKEVLRADGHSEADIRRIIRAGEEKGVQKAEDEVEPGADEEVGRLEETGRQTDFSQEELDRIDALYGAEEGSFFDENGIEVKEQLGLFGNPEKKPFELTPDELTKKEKLARAQDEAKKKGITPKGKKLVFGAGKPIKQVNIGGQKDLFTNDKGQIDIDFKPEKTTGPIRKTVVGVASTGGHVKAAGWVARDMDTAVSLLSQFKDHAQENLFFITTGKNGKILEIHKYSKGTGNSAHHNAVESAGRVLNIPGAEKVYMIHNHPSGDTMPSDFKGDIGAGSTVENILNLKGIGFEGAVIGESSWRSFTSKNVGHDTSIKDNAGDIEIPIKERIILERSSGQKIDDAEGAKRIIRDEYGNQEGFLLLNRKNTDIGFIPFVPGRQSKDITAELIATIENTGAQGIVFKSDKPLGENSERFKYLRDLAVGLAGDTQFIDIIDNTGSPAAIYSIKSAVTDEIYARRKRDAGTRPPATLRRAGMTTPLYTMADAPSEAIDTAARTDISKRHNVPADSLEFHAEWRPMEDHLLYLYNVIKPGHPKHGSTLAYKPSTGETHYVQGDENGNPTPLQANPKFLKTIDRKFRALGNQLFGRDVMKQIHLDLVPEIKREGKNMTESERQWSEIKDPGVIMGAATVDRLNAVIELSTAFPKPTIEKNALHEKVHVAMRWFFPDSDYSMIMKDFGGNEERAAEFGADFLYGKVAKDQKPSSAVMKLFRKLRYFLKRLGYRLGLLNVKTSQDAFDKLWHRGYPLLNKATIAQRIRADKTGVNEFAQPARMSLKGAIKNILDNPNFKKWFGKSVVTDGKDPRVVYHGTAEEFTKFERGWANGHIWGDGFYFTESEQDAQHWAENAGVPGGDTIVMPVYLSIKNPLYLENDSYDGNMAEGLPEDFKEKLRQELDEEYDKYLLEALDGGYVEPMEYGKIGDEIVSYAEDFGYDGVVGTYAGDTHYMAFNPTQIKSIYNQGTFDANNPDIRYQQMAQAWYSQMERFLKDKLPGSGSPKQIAQTLKSWADKGEYKTEELEWSGVLDWLDSYQDIHDQRHKNKEADARSAKMEKEAGGFDPLGLITNKYDVTLPKGPAKVSKQEVLDYLATNNVQIQEVVKGGKDPKYEFKKTSSGRYENGVGATIKNEPVGGEDNWMIYSPSGEPMMDGFQYVEDAITEANSFYLTTDEPKYSQYQTPGGKNYKELLLTLPMRTEYNRAMLELGRKVKKRTGLEAWGYEDMNDAEMAEWDRAQELSRDNPDLHKYRSSHWDEPNVLAHVRFNERADADGNRVLFVEEIQSDFGQDYRKQLKMIEKELANNFKGVVQYMEKIGALEEIC